jgi:hypothetical protein
MLRVPKCHCPLILDCLRALLAAICAFACLDPVFALPPDSPLAQQEAEKMRAVLEANFQAINEENLPALLQTCSRVSGTPEQMAEFASQAKEMFEDTDVYMRLVDFKLTKFQPPRAYATVIQLTLPADQKDAADPEPGGQMGKLEFRHKSALLPEYELSTYKQRFSFENGQWKVHRVVSHVYPAVWPAKSK